MANEQGPKKVGVYGSGAAGTGAAGLNWMWIVAGLIVLALILYFLLT